MAGGTGRSPGSRDLRIAVVADVHAGPDAGSRRGTQVWEALPSLAGELAAFRPDLVIDLGDRVNDASREADLETMRRVRAVLERAGAPVFFVRGNHDTARVELRACEEALGHPLGYRCVDLMGRRLLFLDTCQGPEGLPGLGPPQIERLQRDVAEAPGRCLIFGHHPVDGHSVDGNPLFDDAGYVHPPQGPELRAILTASGAVAAFSGHTHWEHALLLGGVLYTSVPAFGEAWTRDGTIQAAYARVVHRFEEGGPRRRRGRPPGSSLDVVVTSAGRTQPFAREVQSP